MRIHMSGILLAFATRTAGEPAHAQLAGPYLAVTVGEARLHAPAPNFPDATDRFGSAIGGYAFESGTFVEAGLSRLSGSSREGWGGPGSGEGPYTIGLHATLFEISAGYRPTVLRLGPLQPVGAVGAILARTEDTWVSDTPEERQMSKVPGATVTGGLELAVGRYAAIVTRGGYRHMGQSSGRPTRHIGFSGPIAEIGLRFGH